jgi:hypothetical protein
MRTKRYFFVHLAIFAGLCGTFTAAGVSAYQDYLRSAGPEALWAGGGSDGPTVSRNGQLLNGAGVLAVSSGLGTK